MNKIRVYCGWDERDIDAFYICRSSLLRHSSIDVEFIPLKDYELRHKGIYWRSYVLDDRGQKWCERDGKPFSTSFSFTRFAVPILEDYAEEWVLWQDPDMLWRDDIAKLLNLIDSEKSIMCVQHEHRPIEREKMAGLLQTTYKRKNWSSLILFNPSKNTGMTKYALNNMSGGWLHGFMWLQDHEIGKLPEEWNWLEGWSDPEIDPKIVHHTRGSPCLPGYEDVAYADEWRSYLER